MYASHVRRSAASLPDSGTSYNEASRRLGINRAALRAWSRGRSLIDECRDNGDCPAANHSPARRKQPTTTATSIVVSVSRKEAVARVDAFVGPKY
ncbi:hypothetical protein [Nocardiopsis sp. RV163]|uniref:hypothetical protein n=1 Tax=Nocardiopsis sp. RV163 TaxID=1661388 RepID=UPI00128E2C37|nr:hypothetical protein [Nocardiopsis sp. RV163]